VSPQVDAEQHLGLALNGAVVDAGWRHAFRFAVHKLPTAVFQARRRLPVMEFVDGQQRPAIQPEVFNILALWIETDIISGYG